MGGDIESNIETAIKKTGFVLEDKVCKCLENNGWNVISNRYYIDDVKGVEREIDMIAYRTQQVEDVHFYTALIISCKKDEENYWTFLTRDVREDDPNIALYPILSWTNREDLNYMIEQSSVENLIKESSESSIDTIYSLNEYVFAFQRVKNNSPKNDGAIYDSIISTIKASEYERNSLNYRCKKTVFYNFNLISIFEGNMYKAHFSQFDEIEISEIDDIKYLNRHIVNQQENFYRVHFIRFDCLDNYISHFNELHTWNTKIYPKLIEDFYEDIFDNKEKIDVFREDFIKEISPIIENFLREEGITQVEFNKVEEGLNIEVNIYKDELIDQINNTKVIKNITQKALSKYFDYNGDFWYSTFIPF